MGATQTASTSAGEASENKKIETANSTATAKKAASLSLCGCSQRGVLLGDLAELLFPPHRFHHRVFSLKIAGVLYISYPFCWSQSQRESFESESESASLDGFNVAFAIDVLRRPEFAETMTARAQRMWADLATKYVRIVQHEQRRANYLSAQRKRMNELRTEMSKKSKNIDDLLRAMSDDDECAIAGDIRRMQRILSDGDEIDLLVNGWAELHCSLRPKPRAQN